MDMIFFGIGGGVLLLATIVSLHVSSQREAAARADFAKEAADVRGKLFTLQLQNASSQLEADHLRARDALWMSLLPYLPVGTHWEPFVDVPTDRPIDIGALTPDGKFIRIANCYWGRNAWGGDYVGDECWVGLDTQYQKRTPVAYFIPPPTPAWAIADCPALADTVAPAPRGDARLTSQ